MSAIRWIQAALWVFLPAFEVSAAPEGGGLPGQALKEQFAEANRHYEAREYEKARDLYAGLAEKVQSREIQFNLGNCHFRLGQAGLACLAYRRALLVDPSMVEARQNLRFLRSKLGYATFETSRLQQVAGRLTPGEWLWVASLGAWLFVMGVTCRVVFRIRQPWGGMLIALAVCGAMVCLGAGWTAHFLGQRLSPERLAIVVKDGAVALTGPFPDARAVQSLSPGSEVRVEAIRDEWIFVHMPGDTAGWIERRAVAEVRPAQL